MFGGSSLLLWGANFLLWGANFLLCGANFLLCGANFLLRGANFLLRGANFLLRGANFLLCGADFLLRGAGAGLFKNRVGVFTNLSIVADRCSPHTAARLLPNRLRRHLRSTRLGGFSVKIFCTSACGLTNTFRVTRSSAVTSRIHIFGAALDLPSVPWMTANSFRSARTRVRR